MELSVRDLKVSTRRGEVLLDLPHLDVAPGTALGVQGASGAGKSTFLRALMGLAPHASGQVIWGQTQLSKLSVPARAEFRRDQLGMVFQDFLLFDELGALDNAAIQGMFSPRAARPKLAKVAEGLLTELGITSQGRGVASLSGGERQRVAMARALAHDPKALLADEPTASLDQATGDRLTDEMLGRVRDRGLTLVVASHDARLLDRMDRVLVLDHGMAVQTHA